MEPILEIHNISKKYRINKGASSFPTIGESIGKWFGNSKSNFQEFNALEDISFNVNEGETLGIIGKNGAGKSTLLKVISRITTPTSGRIISRGRIASLLEVGTGFHPELSGRENIFLNGVILGMTRKDISLRLDEIIDFSGVEKFIDTPLKHYSSGMQLRLAFAVAAFLEPEILIIDEVLAVGDAEFQKKCIGKMQNVSSSGRTILFVSHNLSVLKTLCTKSILLSGGKLIQQGKTDDVVLTYQKSLSDLTNLKITGNQLIKLSEFKMLNQLGEAVESFNTFDAITFRMKYKCFQSISNVTFAICFDNISKQRVSSYWSAFQNEKFSFSEEEFEFEIHVPKVRMDPGIYEMILYIESGGIVIERIDNFKNIVVGIDVNVHEGHIPTESHGYFVEDFTVKKI